MFDPEEVFWSEEDEGFIALDMKRVGCSAWGETEEEALAELEKARQAWDEAQRAAGNVK
jgi:antitoxin HicB